MVLIQRLSSIIILSLLLTQCSSLDSFKQTQENNISDASSATSDTNTKSIERLAKLNRIIESQLIITENPYLSNPKNLTSDDQKRFDQANLAMQQQDWQTAVSILQTLLQQHPDGSGIHLNLAIISSQQKNWPQAEQHALAAISANQSNYFAHTQLGMIYRAQGKLLEAEESYLNAISLWPTHTAAWLNLGILYDLYLNDIEPATVAYQAYLKQTDEPDSRQTKRVKSWLKQLARRKNSSS